MPTPVIMPKFEMTQETGKVVAWLADEGQTVAKGDPLLEVETDKVNQEVEAPASGILAGIAAAPGEVVPIATPIAYILKPGESLPVPAPTPAAASAAPVAPSPAAESAQFVESVASRPVTPLAARLAEDRGLDLGRVPGTGPGGRITKEDVEAALAASSGGGAAGGEGKVRAAPAARRLASELGVALAGVQGSGPQGRIQPADVRAAAEAAASAASAPVPAPPAPVALPAAAAGAPSVRRITPLSNIRRTIAERMTASAREAPQFIVTVDADMTRALAVVEDLKAAPEEGKPKVTVTALIVKACAWALAQHPEANASYSPDGIVEWAEVNVGVATAIDQGLIVPVIRDTDRLGLRAIAGQLAALTQRAREGRLQLADLQGGTFTVSNLGMFGIDRFTAIVNPPQAAILAVGRVAKSPVVTADDRVEVRPVCTLNLTSDHRVLDGAGAARFLATIQRVLEHPGLLME